MSIIYIASKAFTHFLLPPGLFITIFLALATVFRRCRVVLIILALSLWLFSTNFFASLLLSTLEEKYRVHDTPNDVEFVVVLGGGLVEESPDLLLSNGALKRGLTGFLEAKNRGLPLIYTGGGNKELSEAEAFYKDITKLYGNKLPLEENLTKKGFYVVLENSSLDTFENAKFVKKIFDDSGIKSPKIILVTSAFHQKRALEIFEKFGFEATPLACDFRSSGIETDFRDFLPSMLGLDNLFLTLREYFGIWSLSFR